MTARLGALLAAELRTEWRYAVPPVLLGLAAAWAVLLVLLPTDTARSTAPYLVFVDTMGVATTVLGALLVMERSTGGAAALRTSPARPGEYVAARLLPLAVLTTLCGIPVLLAGGDRGRQLGLALATLGLAGLLLLALAAGVAARRDTFVGFLTTVPWPMVPLISVPLAVAIGLLEGPVWYAVPTTGALSLLRGDAPYPALLLLGYLALWSAAATWLAVRLVARRDDAGSAARATRGGGIPLRPRWLVFPRADLRNVRRDSILVPLVASPLLLGLALRFGYPPFERWLADAHGLVIAEHRPVIAMLTVVLHVPVIFGMTGALIVLDDLDEGALRIVRVSPVSIRRYLAYRLGLATALAALGLAVAAPLSGLVPASAWGAALLAVPLAPLFMLAMLALAGSRVQGVTAGKALGLPAYLPLAAWWITGPAGWAFGAVPTYWVVRTWDGSGTGWFVGGVLCSAVWGGLLLRRVLRRLRTL